MIFQAKLINLNSAGLFVEELRASFRALRA